MRSILVAEIVSLYIQQISSIGRYSHNKTAHIAKLHRNYIQTGLSKLSYYQSHDAIIVDMLMPIFSSRANLTSIFT